MAEAVDWARGRALWDEGRTGMEIAGQIGTSESSVYRVRREQGWPSRQRARSGVPPALRCRCAWCAAVYAIPGPDAARVCPHCALPEPVM